MGQVIYSIMAV